MKTISLLMTVTLIFTVMLGCEKYDEGGSMAKADKTITETLWKIESATDLEDNVDITKDYASEIWEFTEDGIFKINSKVEGTYTFSVDMKKLFIANNSGTEADIYTIDRMDNEAMWLAMPFKLELHFIPYN